MANVNIDELTGYLARKDFEKLIDGIDNRKLYKGELVQGKGGMLVVEDLQEQWADRFHGLYEAWRALLMQFVVPGGGVKMK